MNREKDNSTIKEDRVLGEQWKDWDGNFNAESKIINERKRIFLVPLLLVIILTIIGSFLLLYLVAPRLKLLNPILFKSVTFIVLFFTLVLLSWYTSLLITIAYGKRIFFAKNFNKRALIFVIDKTIKLGGRFGISRDRMANSFLKVFNIIVQTDSNRILPLKPLIILPRCLESDLREKAKELAEKYNLEAFIVGGGESAKAKVKEKNPQAVIGVACERDLLSGLKEISLKIPVVALPNKRPYGPCKKTQMDIYELEKAIKYFLNV